VKEEIHELLEREEQAQGIVSDGMARAQKIRQQATENRGERLARARQEAREAAEEARNRILAETDPTCRAELTAAEKDAEMIREQAAPRIDSAVQAAVMWLLIEGATHAGRS